MVLENRPYHFAKYMIILQRWETTISKSFPSEISFWIQIQGILPHLWTEEIVRSIGEDIGQFKSLEISSTVARMRVHINGLQPLVTTSIVEFSNGDEVEVNLIYEKLEKHCSFCLRLDHEKKDCPNLYPSRARSSPPNPNRERSRNQDKYLHPLLDKPRHYTSSRYVDERLGEHKHYTKSNHALSHSQIREQNYQHREHRDTTTSRYQSPSGQSTSHHYPPPLGRNYSTRRGSESYTSRSRHLHHSDRGDGHGHKSSSSYAPIGHHLEGTRGSHHSSSGHNSRRLEYRRVSPTRQKTSQQREPEQLRESSSILRTNLSPGQTRRSFSEADQGQVSPPPHVPKAAMDVALGELRDVMVQYASCADPTESAARKERLRQAEEHGEFEETAEQMVRANLSLDGQEDRRELSPGQEDQRELSPAQPSSSGRISVALRLGPTNPPGPPPIPIKRIVSKLKKKRGRPSKVLLLQQSPRIPLVGNAKKRKLMQKNTNPRRRLNMEHNEANYQSGEGSKANASSADATSNRGQAVLQDANCQDNVELMDFRNPSELLP